MFETKTSLQTIHYVCKKMPLGWEYGRCFFLHFPCIQNKQNEHNATNFQLPVQAVLITTKFVISNPTHGKMYLIQQYVIKFVSDLCQVCGSLRVP